MLPSFLILILIFILTTGGLNAEFNRDTLFPEYSLSVSPEDVFGPLSPQFQSEASARVTVFGAGEGAATGAPGRGSGASSQQNSHLRDSCSQQVLWTERSPKHREQNDIKRLDTLCSLMMDGI